MPNIEPLSERDMKRYEGKHVCTYSFNDKRVAGYGDTPEEAYEMAKKNGAEKPVHIFVSKYPFCFNTKDKMNDVIF